MWHVNNFTQSIFWGKKNVATPILWILLCDFNAQQTVCLEAFLKMYVLIECSNILLLICIHLFVYFYFQFIMRIHHTHANILQGHVVFNNKFIRTFVTLNVFFSHRHGDGGCFRNIRSKWRNCLFSSSNQSGAFAHDNKYICTCRLFWRKVGFPGTTSSC